MILSSYSFAAVGDTFVIDGITYIIKSDKTVGISKVDSKIKTFNLKSTVISNNGVDYTIVSVEEGAFKWSDIETVELPATIDTIAYQAFGSCKELKSVILPASLKHIGGYAFNGCKRLKSIVIPEGVETIGDGDYEGTSFGSCDSLTNVTLPSTLKRIARATFFHCPMLKSIIIPDSVTFIGAVSFNMCSALESVTLSANLKSLECGVFGDCESLTTINNVPANIEKICEEAFLNAPITSFKIPATCEFIGPRAFAGTKLLNYEVEEGNPVYEVVDGVLYDKKLNVMAGYPGGKSTDVYEVKAGCRGIGAGAFMNTDVKKIVLPESIVAIDEFAFTFCTVSDINIPERVVLIGQQAFAASNIKNITLPSKLTFVSEALFAGCESLETVTIPSSVKTMGIRTFWKCKMLNKVSFLGYDAPKVDYWEYAPEQPFYGIDKKTVTITCPKGRLSVYEQEFGSYEAIKEIIDTEAGVMRISSFNPAANSEVSILDNLGITFNEEVTKVIDNPDIKVTCGELISGIPVGEVKSVGMWVLNTSDNKTYNAIPLDEYGEGGEPIYMDKGKKYYIEIPTGVFKNADGALNEYTIIEYTGSYVLPELKVVETNPVNGAELEELGTVEITFEEKPYKKYGAEDHIKLLKGDLNNNDVFEGVAIMPEDHWGVNVSGNKVCIFPADADSYVCPIKLEDGANYCMIIDQGAFYNNDAKNYEIKISLKGKFIPTSISDAEAKEEYIVKKADGLEVHSSTTGTVQVFNGAGQMEQRVNINGVAYINNLTHGMYLIKLTTEKGVKIFKVVL